MSSLVVQVRRKVIQVIINKTGATGAPGLVWRGEYDNATEYAVNEVVYYLGSSYVATAETVGNLPTDTDFWGVLALAGTGGGGGGGDVAGSINDADDKAAPVDADRFALTDSAASFILKRVTWANLKATLKIYLDTLYSPLGHNHDDRYFTEAETTALLGGKADTVHTHVIGDVTSLQATLDDKQPKEDRTTFSNANYSALSTDQYVAQIGTMTADRTVTLPQASSVAAGTKLIIADESGTVGRTTGTTDYSIIISAYAGDTLKTPAFRGVTSDKITTPYDSRTYVSDGTNKWVALNPGDKRPVVWYAHGNKVALPSGVWVPLPWNVKYIDTDNSNPLYTTAYTLHSDMNGLALPQATIKVNESIASLPTTGWLVITIASGIDTVVHYTGKSGTSFTGCNTAPWAGISTGTMATSQVVKQAFVGVAFKTPYLYAMIAAAAFSAHPNGWRGLRVAGYLFAESLVVPYGPATDTPSLNIENQRLTTPFQPPSQVDQGWQSHQIVQLYQNSGTVLYSTVNTLDTPIIMAVHASGE